EDLLLLVPEPLELPLDLGAGLLVLGRLEGRLQLLEPLVEVGLPLRQLLEPVDHLPRLLLFLLALRALILLGAGRALLLVAVLFVRQLELLELPIRRAAGGRAGLAALARIAPDDVELAGA